VSDNSLPGRAAAERQAAGPFRPHLTSFVSATQKMGYAGWSVRERLRLLGDLERWLGRERLSLVDLQEQVASRFLEQRRRKGRLRRSDAATVRLFLAHLREAGAVRPPEPTVDDSPLASLRRLYQGHLETERGLPPATVGRYWPFVRRFLVERFGGGPVCVRQLVPDDVSRFLLRHARSGSPGVARLMVTALRSFFRFLFLRPVRRRGCAWWVCRRSRTLISPPHPPAFP
jgi:hypothetical protein